MAQTKLNGYPVSDGNFHHRGKKNAARLAGIICHGGVIELLA
ncbi:hypothetical protein DAQ1742_03737 [Dickeya aquatica]|uniref:Uncharacterized protein n=1 Tax=Dickeya aquatica TaxID=1401087 RepID=A0A375AF67_9GAMM|nr:hypothetical protein DAQ1742_03737 [Dickeya aquatica]